jgi:hypothetical protein
VSRRHARRVHWQFQRHAIHQGLAHKVWRIQWVLAFAGRIQPGIPRGLADVVENRLMTP